MTKPTQTQIKEYIKTLNDDLQKLYWQVETAYLLTLHDTLSDEFQIVASILDVFSVQATKRILDQTEEKDF